MAYGVLTYNYYKCLQMKLIVNHNELANKLSSIDIKVNQTEQFNLIIVKTPFGIKRIKTTLSFDEWKKSNNIKNEKTNHIKSKSRKKNK
jgi:hypothetical protein